MTGTRAPAREVSNPVPLGTAFVAKRPPRTFGEDVWKCGRCGGRRRIVAVVTSHRTLTTIPVRLTTPRTLTGKASEPWVIIGFEVPSLLDEGSPPFETLKFLFASAEGPLRRLTGKETSITQVAISAGPGFAERHLMTIALRLRGGRSPSEARAAFFQALRDWTPSDLELAGARASLERRHLERLRSRRELAAALSKHLLLTADWHEVFVPRHRLVASAAVLSALESLVPEKAWILELAP